MGYPTRVLVKQATAIGNGDEYQFADPVAAYCQFRPDKRVSVQTDRGWVQQNQPQFTFIPGSTDDKIRASSGSSLELTTGSILIVNSQYYRVMRVEQIVNADTGRVTDVRAVTEFGGAAYDQRETADGNYRITADGKQRIVRAA